ncbi:MAG: DUF4330 domain-containing protein [Candidatus Gastranaerophilaceae bacterium]
MKYNKLVDIIILTAILIAVCIGIVTMKHYRETASKQIEATSQISFTVLLKGVVLKDNTIPIKKDETTFISIRNVPYTDLQITNVESFPKMITVAANNSIGYKSVPDSAQPNTYDISVTVKDTAKITKDGAVVGGNKIKIGLPITLEGKVYKLAGIVSDIKL